MRHRRTTIHSLFVACILLLSGGCAKELPIAEVEGVFTSGGKPLSRLRLQFIPDPYKGTLGPTSVAATDEGGRFKLVCPDRNRPGAMVGWHKVIVTDLTVGITRNWTPGRKDDDERLPPQKIAQPRVANKYGMSDKTPLEVEVKPDKNELRFEVNKKEITVGAGK